MLDELAAKTPFLAAMLALRRILGGPVPDDDGKRRLTWLFTHGLHGERGFRKRLGRRLAIRRQVIACPVTAVSRAQWAICSRSSSCSLPVKDHRT